MDSRILYPWILVLLLCAAVIYAYQQRPRVLETATQVSQLQLPDGSRYGGELKDGLLHGTGLWIHANGDEYEGEFVKGVFQGKGHFKGADGSRYSGDFKHGLFHGEGEYFDAEGERYQGWFEEGLLNGEGEHWDTDGKHYQGEFEYGYYHGKGVLTEVRGVYRGEFKHGYFDGEGELTYADSDRVDKGEWSWGEFQDPQLAQQKQQQIQKLEAAIYQQTHLIQQATDALLPSDASAINLYFVGVGGYSRQDVFRKELDVIRTQMDEHFGSAGRSLLLLNHYDTLDQWPLATTISLEQSLAAVARKMDVEKDILFLYLTSHGSRDHKFSLVQDGLSLPDLDARHLGEIIRQLPVRWKVIVVSACYSGGFIPHLTSPDTLVMAAARRDRRSFGCSDDSEMTYFGRAYFVDALPQAESFEEAFAISRKLIRAREKEMDKNVKHSFPQISTGEAIAAYLPGYWKQLERASPVPAVSGLNP